MLKIAPKKTFLCQVNLHVPGEIEPGKINITFNFLDREKVIDWQKTFAKKPINEALEEVINAWDGVFSEDDQPVPYSPENLKKLLIAYHSAGDEITQAYLRELVGARRKN